MKKTLLILVAIALFGCKAKTVTAHTHSTDTLRVEKIVRITPAQLNNLVIDSPCDSLGNLKPFNYQFGNGKNKTTVKTLKNTIVVEQNLDSIKSVWEKEYKAKTDSRKEEKETFKTPVWVWKVIVFLLMIILLETLYILILKKIKL